MFEDKRTEYKDKICILVYDEEQDKEKEMIFPITRTEYNMLERLDKHKVIEIIKHKMDKADEDIPMEYRLRYDGSMKCFVNVVKDVMTDGELEDLR